MWRIICLNIWMLYKRTVYGNPSHACYALRQSPLAGLALPNKQQEAIIVTEVERTLAQPHEIWLACG